MKKTIDSTILADKIRTKLDQMGINQAELSRRAGITRGALSQILNGDRIPNTNVIVAVADVLMVSTDYLIGKTTKSEVEALLQHERVCELVNSFVALSDSDQRRVLDLIKLLLTAQSPR